MAQPFRPRPDSILRVPRSCVFCRGGYGAADTMGYALRSAPHLRRSSPALYYLLLLSALVIGACLFSIPPAAATASSILEQTRERYRFVVLGYVVMPEHIHLLITEPEIGTPSGEVKINEGWGTISFQDRAA